MDRVDILDKIKQDHDDFKHMFTKMNEKRAQGTQDEAIFQELRRRVTAHMEIEEEVLYPALEKHAKSTRHALQGFEEHDIAKELLTGLQQMPRDVERWAAKFQVFQQLLRLHISEEEAAIFRDTRSEISEEQRREWGDQWDRMVEDKLSKMT